MVTIRHITMDDPLYPQECTLRDVVLLNPIEYSMERFRAEYVGVEERFEHFVAVVAHPSGEKVIGCVTLLPSADDATVGKLMQMAVDAQRQGEGIGRKLVVAVEAHAARVGITKLYCHARDTAIPFYAKLGWEIQSDWFDEAGIAHKKMGIDLDAV